MRFLPYGILRCSRQNKLFLTERAPIRDPPTCGGSLLMGLIIHHEVDEAVDVFSLVCYDLKLRDLAV